MDNKFTFKRLRRFDKNALRDLNSLLVQFPRDYQMSPGYFKTLIKNSHILALYDKKNIVATATLIDLYKLSGFKGSIEHVVVDKRYRGQGLGKKLMEHLISYAKGIKMKTLFLTVDTDNKSANGLYQKMGFKIMKTNFCQLDLK